jgi:hypothetical protein
MMIHPTPLNPAASGTGAMAFLFHVGRLGRAVPELVVATYDAAPKHVS